jgi:hypothetical protein
MTDKPDNHSKTPRDDSPEEEPIIDLLEEVSGSAAHDDQPEESDFETFDPLSLLEDETDALAPLEEDAFDFEEESDELEDIDMQAFEDEETLPEDDFELPEIDADDELDSILNDIVMDSDATEVAELDGAELAAENEESDGLELLDEDDELIDLDEIVVSEPESTEEAAFTLGDEGFEFADAGETAADLTLTEPLEAGTEAKDSLSTEAAGHSETEYASSDSEEAGKEELETVEEFESDLDAVEEENLFVFEDGQNEEEVVDIEEFEEDFLDESETPLDLTGDLYEDAEAGEDFLELTDVEEGSAEAWGPSEEFFDLDESTGTIESEPVDAGSGEQDIEVMHEPEEASMDADFLGIDPSPLEDVESIGSEDFESSYASSVDSQPADASSVPEPPTGPLPDFEAPSADVTQQPDTGAPEGLSEAALEAAVERIIREKYSPQIKAIISRAIEKAVTQEINRYRDLLLRDKDADDSE